MSAPVGAEGPEDLVGVWKLVLWQVIVDNGPPHDVFGSQPKGLPDPDTRGRALVSR